MTLLHIITVHLNPVSRLSEMKLPVAWIDMTTLCVDAKKCTNWNCSFNIRKQNC